MVEQGTHKPLVGSSTLPPGTNKGRRIGVGGVDVRARSVSFVSKLNSWLALIQSQEELVCLVSRMLWNFLNHHFYLGLCIGAVLGLIGIAFAVMRLMDTKGEVRRLKRHLSDKLELESEATNRLRLDLQELKQHNENLRIKVANLNQFPDQTNATRTGDLREGRTVYGLEFARVSGGVGRGEA